jgi:hypothetical protein
LPDWAHGTFTSVTRTPDELSIVCPQAEVPVGVQVRQGWRALKVAGPLDFALTGVLATLTRTLAEAGIPLLAVATWDTDWLLVRTPDLERTLTTLERAGHRILPE